MNSPTDTLRDRFGTALQEALKKAIPEVRGGVYWEIDRAYREGDYPCLSIQLGHVHATYQAGGYAGSGDRLLALEYALTIDVVDDDTVESFRRTTKNVSAAVRKALAHFNSLVPSPNIQDLLYVGEMPAGFESESGRAGGFAITYSVSFEVLESEQETAL